MRRRRGGAVVLAFLVLGLAALAGTAVPTAHADGPPGTSFTPDDLNEMLRIMQLLTPEGGTPASEAEYQQLIDFVERAQLYINFGDQCLDCAALDQVQAALADANSELATSTPAAETWSSLQQTWNTIKGATADATGVDSEEALGLLELEGDAGLLLTDAATGAALVAPPGALIAAGVGAIVVVQIGFGKFLQIAVPTPDIPDHDDLSTKGFVYEKDIPGIDDGYYLAFSGTVGSTEWVNKFIVHSPSQCDDWAASSHASYMCSFDADEGQLWTEAWDWFGFSGSVSVAASFPSYSSPEGISGAYARQQPIGTMTDGGVAVGAGTLPTGSLVTTWDPTFGTRWNAPLPTTPTDPRVTRVRNRITSTEPGMSVVRGKVNHSVAPNRWPTPTVSDPEPPYVAPGADPYPGVSPWTMPDCLGSTFDECYDLVAPVAPPTVHIIEVPARVHVPSYPDGAVIATDPAGGSETQRNDVYVETNPAPDTKTVPALLPEPNRQTYPQYIAQLQALGLVGQVVPLSLTTGDPNMGPQRVVRTSPAPGQQVNPGTTVLVYANPDDWPYPEPDPNPDPDPDPNPPPPPPPGPPGPPDPGPGGDPTTGIDFTPLNIDFGCKFPYGFICYAKQVTRWFSVTPQAPDFAIPVHVHTSLVDWQGTYDVNLGEVGTSSGSLTAPSSLDDYMAIIRLLESIVIWIGGVYVLATRFLGFGAAGDPGEAVDEAGSGLW